MWLKNLLSYNWSLAQLTGIYSPGALSRYPLDTYLGIQGNLLRYQIYPGEWCLHPEEIQSSEAKPITNAESDNWVWFFLVELNSPLGQGILAQEWFSGLLYVF